MEWKDEVIYSGWKDHGRKPVAKQALIADSDITTPVSYSTAASSTACHYWYFPATAAALTTIPPRFAMRVKEIKYLAQFSAHTKELMLC